MQVGDGGGVRVSAPLRAGDVGSTVSFLRPYGLAHFDGRLVDVVSDGSFIPQDVPVVVVAVDDGRVEVARCADPVL